MKLRNRKDYRVRRHQRIRKKISGTGDRPRMAIMKSNRHLYVQFVDDAAQMTLASAGTLGAEGNNDVSSARALGKRAAEAALAKGVKDVVVDRGGFPYHGRIKALVDAVREAGLSMGSGAAPAANAAENKEEK